MAPPLLLSLFLYQLVDDIWLRPLALALLLVLLPALNQAAQQPTSPQPAHQQKAPQRWLQRFDFAAVTYRLLAVVGVLLITLSAVLPGGVCFAPSDRVAMPKATCLLFF